MRFIITAGNTIAKLTLNLSFIPTSCVLVAAIVVSDIKDILSPNIAPPITTPQTNGKAIPVSLAIPTATGVKALTVPIEVPIEKLKAHPTKNNPGNNNLAGKTDNPKLTVELTAPIASATE